MNIRFWVLLAILMLLAGCATGTYESSDQGSEYWNYILYHQDLPPSHE